MNDNRNDNHNNYKNYKDYNKRRMKKPSRTAVQVSSLKRTNERERKVGKERKRGDFVWSTGKMKSLPSEQVSSTVKTNIAVIQWNFNESDKQNGNVTWRTMPQRKQVPAANQTIYVRPGDDPTHCYKEGCKIKRHTELNALLKANE